MTPKETAEKVLEAFNTCRRSSFASMEWQNMAHTLALEFTKREGEKVILEDLGQCTDVRESINSILDIDILDYIEDAGSLDSMRFKTWDELTTSQRDNLKWVIQSKFKAFHHAENLKLQEEANHGKEE